MPGRGDRPAAELGVVAEGDAQYGDGKQQHIRLLLILLQNQFITCSPWCQVFSAAACAYVAAYCTRALFASAIEQQVGHVQRWLGWHGMNENRARRVVGTVGGSPVEDSPFYRTAIDAL